MKITKIEIWIYLFGSLIIIGSLFTTNAVAISICSITLIISVVAYRGWYIIEPLVIRAIHAIEIFGDYELSYDRSCATHKAGKIFSSTAMATLSLGMNPDIDRRRLEDIIARIGFPFRLTLSVETLNSERLLDDLRTKLHSKEIALTRIENRSRGRGKLRAMQLDREIDATKGEIAALAAAGTPLKLAYYASTSAISGYRHIAEAEVLRNIRVLAAELGGLLGGAVTQLKGAELIEALEIDAGANHEHNN